MAGSIERVLSPEEIELQRYLDEIERLKSDIAAKLEDLESYKAELARFSAEYHVVLGPLFAELDRLELEIEEFRERIRLLEASPELAPHEVEEQVEQQFRFKRERLDEEEAQNEAYESAWREEEAKPELDEDDAVELKRTYRDLAKKHHPDFAVDEQDRSEREAAMQKINAAFASKNLSSLYSMKESLQDHLAAFEKLPIGEKLVWAIREVSRLRSLSITIEKERLQLQQGSLGLLMDKHFEDEPVILAIKDTVLRRIEYRTHDLKGLIDEYGRLRIMPSLELRDE